MNSWRNAQILPSARTRHGEKNTLQDLTALKGSEPTTLLFQKASVSNLQLDHVFGQGGMTDLGPETCFKLYTVIDALSTLHIL